MQNIQRLRQDATPADETQNPFLLMHLSSLMMATAKGLTLSHLPCSPEARMPPLLGVLVPVHH